MKQFPLIFLFAWFTNAVFAQNTLDLAGLSSSTPATAAYSLRKLSSTYSGSAVQVRRSSDNSTQDIGFTSGGDLDITALNTFVGSNNGYVSIWYDQSGNGYNALSSESPLIVNAGTLNTSNGLPSILINGNKISYSPISPFNSFTDHTLNTVAAATTGTIVCLSTATGASAGNKNSCLGAGFNGTGAAWYGGFNQNATYAAGSSTPALSVRSKTYGSSTINGFFNGSNIFTTTVPYNLTIPNILIGAQNFNPNQPLSGSASEIIVFTTALTAPQRLSLEYNQGIYYSVTVNSALNNPTISGFGDITKFNGDPSFTLTAPTSNSTGLFSYTSSNTSVATIINNTVTINGAGTTKITATGAADPNYNSGTITAILSVSEKGLNRYGQIESISSNYLNKNGSISVSGLTNTEVNKNGRIIKSIAVGNIYQGGIIAYILQPGNPGYVAGQVHGLIAATTDQSSGGALYGCSGSTLGASGTSIGTGNSNTTIILSNCVVVGTASQICRAYNGGGFTDWYLPSKDELNLLYLNIGQGASGSNANIGGFSTGNSYWSSSEINFEAAISQNFLNGTQYSYFYKVNVQLVRAVRSF